MFTTNPEQSPKRRKAVGDVNTPLSTFQPTVVAAEVGLRYAVWPVNAPGTQMAVGLLRIGFRVEQQGGDYRLPLDAEADELLLRLYAVVTNLRWRTPYRQLTLLEAAVVHEERRHG